MTLQNTSTSNHKHRRIQYKPIQNSHRFLSISSHTSTSLSFPFPSPKTQIPFFQPLLLSSHHYLAPCPPLQVILQVHQSPEYVIVREPSSHGPEGVLEICVAGNSKVVLEVKIKPTVLGEVNITVEASVNRKAGRECGTSPAHFSRRLAQGGIELHTLLLDF